MATAFRTLIVATAVAFLAYDPAAAQRSVSPAAGTDSAALRARGVDLGYNLDHAEALDAFSRAIAVDPSNPAAYRLVAGTMWINVLFRHGAVTAEDFLGQAGSSATRPKAADLDRRFRESLDKAIVLAEARLHDAGPSNADAHYQIGAAYGFLASYTATIEGSLMSALGPSKRAYAEHSKVLELDPSRRDAGLIVGLYRYGVSVLPLWQRMLASVAGFGGGRERGIKLVEEAASHPSDVQTNARFALIVIYNREKRYDDALRVIAQLQQQFPRNRLLWLEAGSTALRAGRAAEANALLEQGLTRLASDSRPRAFGELARWRYQHGLALAALKRNDTAQIAFADALAGEGPDWIRGRAHLELGRLAAQAADRTRAAEEYRQAVQLCTAAKDASCVTDTRKQSDLLRRGR